MKKMIMLVGGILSPFTMFSMASEHSDDGLYNEVYIDAACSEVKGFLTFNFHNMTGSYVNIESANDKLGIWDSYAVKVVQEESYSNHYTRWEYAKKSKVADYENNEPISSLVLPPYSRRKFNVFYDAAFDLKSGERYVLYLTFSAYINSYPFDFKVFRTNKLFISSNNCQSNQ